MSSPNQPPAGLSATEAQRRLNRLGEWQHETTRTVGQIVRSNIFTIFNLIIGIFFVLILSLGLWADAIFGVIAIVNTGIGIWQEVRAKRKLDELALLIAPRAKVIRDAEIYELGADEVVPGDVVRVEPGDQLVADGHLVQVRGLVIDESALTGESDGIRKRVGDEVLSGTFVVSGSGYYEIESVRDDSHAARIAGAAREFRHPPSPLQREVNRILIVTSLAMIPLAIILIATLILRETELVEAAQTATAGLITLVPEGLVLLMSVALAVATLKLARINMVVQKLGATETLASVDTVCVDKTGTLTSGELMFETLEIPAGGDRAIAERALGSYAATSGERNRTLDIIAEQFPGHRVEHLAEVPFSSARKWSGLTIEGRDGAVTYILGAPDVLAASGQLELDGHSREVIERQTRAGNRVLAFAGSREILADGPEPVLPPLRLLALIVLSEQLRPDATDVVADLRERGVDLKVISGDSPETVGAVAAAVGIDGADRVMDGSRLPADRAGLAAAARDTTVFGRVTPDQKRDLISALAADGRLVAMIGDGVNDVPALKKAGLAVAMGSGSQIAKGVGDIVLLQDEFATLPRAIEEGRRIARNIHRLGRLYLTKSVYAGVLLLITAAFGMTFPFLPRHLTIAALLTIGIPSFVLALAPSSGPLYRGRLLGALAEFAIPAGVATAIATTLSFLLVDGIGGGDLTEARTAATTTLIVLGLSFILLLERGPGREHITIQSYMLAMVAGLGALYALIFSVEPLRTFFDLALLEPSQWFIALLAVAGGLVIAAFGWRIPWIERLDRGETT